MLCPVDTMSGTLYMHILKKFYYQKVLHTIHTHVSRLSVRLQSNLTELFYPDLYLSRQWVSFTIDDGHVHYP